jgi:hypothetical protein
VLGDETRGYQLCHYDVVVIQLAALGCNRLVGLGSNPACNRLALAPSSATVYLTVLAMGTGFDSCIGPCVSTRMWGSPFGGGSVHRTLPYALTCEPALYTFDETRGYQLCHYDGLGSIPGSDHAHQDACGGVPMAGGLCVVSERTYLSDHVIHF